MPHKSANLEPDGQNGVVSDPVADGGAGRARTSPLGRNVRLEHHADGGLLHPPVDLGGARLVCVAAIPRMMICDGGSVIVMVRQRIRRVTRTKAYFDRVMASWRWSARCGA